MIVKLTAAQIAALLQIADNALNDPDLWGGAAMAQPNDGRNAATLARATVALRKAVAE